MAGPLLLPGPHSTPPKGPPNPPCTGRTGKVLQLPNVVKADSQQIQPSRWKVPWHMFGLGCGMYGILKPHASSFRGLSLS